MFGTTLADRDAQAKSAAVAGGWDQLTTSCVSFSTVGRLRRNDFACPVQMRWSAAERLLAVFLSVWEDPEARLPLVALIRGGITREPAANLLRDGVFAGWARQLADVLDPAEAKIRGKLAASQMLGLVLARYHSSSSNRWRLCRRMSCSRG